jgi:hypothetical protein
MALASSCGSKKPKLGFVSDANYCVPDLGTISFGAVTGGLAVEAISGNSPAAAQSMGVTTQLAIQYGLALNLNVGSNKNGTLRVSLLQELGEGSQTPKSLIVLPNGGQGIRVSDGDRSTQDLALGSGQVDFAFNEPVTTEPNFIYWVFLTGIYPGENPSIIWQTMSGNGLAQNESGTWTQVDNQQGIAAFIPCAVLENKK